MNRDASRQQFLKNILDGWALPRAVREHPGMLCLEERFSFYRLAAEYFEGSGIILDAGVFLGASTACFCSGLARKFGAPPRQPLVHAYELGIADEVVAPIINWYHKEAVQVSAGDSFDHLLRSLTQPYQDWVRFHIGDIRETLSSDGPRIEIFFLDCAKRNSVNEYVLRAALPRLIPGHSIIVQQDYFHEWLPWLHVSMGALGDNIAYMGSAGTSAFFVVTREISEQLAIAAGSAWRTQKGDQGMALFEAGVAMRKWPAEEWMVNLARASALRWFKGLEVAMDYLKGVRPPEPEENTWSFTFNTDKSPVEVWLNSPSFMSWMAD